MIYRITQLARPDRGGADAPLTAEIGGLAKTNDRNPFTITNEVVCELWGEPNGGTRKPNLEPHTQVEARALVATSPA
jgi:hypothetical protein